MELDLSKDCLGGGIVRVGQGDSGGTTIEALIYDGGAEAALDGYAGYLEVLLPDKRHYYRAAAAVAGNTATVTVDESKLCAVAGYTDEAYFAFERDGARYSTERFAIEILRCVTYGQQPAKNWDDAIGCLVNKGSAAVARAEAAADAASSAASRVESAVASAGAATETAEAAASSANYAASAAGTAAANAIAAADRADSAAAAAERAAEAAAAAANPYPVGITILSKVEMNPALEFGGEWEYDEAHHNFARDYRYTRIA